LLVTTWFLDGGFSSPKNCHIFEIFLWKIRVMGAFSQGGLRQRQTQIPFGNDNKKSNGSFPSGMTRKSDGKSKGESWNREPGCGVPCFVP